MSPPEGYCESGVYYIGDADECERCRLFEQMMAREQVFNAALDAHHLTLALSGE